MSTKRALSLGAVGVLLWSAPALAADFTYNPPGQLVSGSGSGRVDETVFVPDMRFPIEVAPAYPNSQVWGVGGSSGPSGGQCDARNYSYPWSDNFCETRTWDVPMCPGGKGHQGQDIRPSTCEKDKHWVVSAEDGTITEIGTYSVYVVSETGTRHRYLHMEPSSLTVKVGDKVAQGQRLGRVSNAFGGTPTTIHLHYDIFQTVEGVGPSYVPPYMSLVRSYERLLGTPAQPCDTIPAQGKILDDDNACFQLLGNLQYWRVINDAGYNNRLYWTYAYTASAPGSYVRWKLNFAEAGKYKVEVYLEADYAQSKEAIYKVRHAGKDDSLRFDQSAGSGWRTLGEWEFAAGDNQHLEMNDNTGEERTLDRKMTADAIRLTRVDGETPIEEDMGSPDMGSVTPDLGGQPSVDMGGSGVGVDMGDGGAQGGDPQTVSSSSCAQASGAGAPVRGGVQLLLTLFGLLGLRVRSRRRVHA